MHKSRQISNVRKITTIAIMGAIAFVLMYIEFSIPIMPGFIKMDFSELPAVLTSFALGPWYGALVCLIKNLLHLPFTTTAGVGELANFILGVFFTVPAGYIYKINRTKKNALIGSLVGAVIMALISFPSNYFVVYPFYTNFMPMEAIIGAYSAILPSVKTLPQALLIFNVPFTFFKAMANVLITFLIYKRISPLILGIAKENTKKVVKEEIVKEENQ